MNIKPVNGFIKSNPLSKTQNASSDTLSKAKSPVTDIKTDSITISAQGTFQAELDKEIKSIASDISRLDNEDKISSLKELIKSGDYKVSSNDLVESMLSSFENTL